jgi:hypothetical protein
MKKKEIWAYDRLQVPTIASGATPIGSAGRAPDEELREAKNWRTRKKNSSPLSVASIRK